MVAVQKYETEHASPFVIFIVLLAGGLLVFLPVIPFSAEISLQFRGGTAVTLLGITLLSRFHHRYKDY